MICALLYQVTMHKRDVCRSAVAGLLAVTFVYYVETAKDCSCGMRIGNRTKASDWYRFQ